MVELASLTGLAHSSQNFACGRFSCWQRGQCISNGSRFRLAAGHDHASPDPGQPPELGVPAVPWGTGVPTVPRPGLGRQMGDSGRGSPKRLSGDPNRLRRVKPHVYATLLPATRHPEVLTQPAGGPSEPRDMREVFQPAVPGGGNVGTLAMTGSHVGALTSCTVRAR